MEETINLGKVREGKVEYLQELSKEQIELYDKYSKELIEINKTTWPFLIAKENYFLFMEETLADFKNVNFAGEVPWEFMQEKTIQSNRRLFNFLGSFFSYVDHTKTYLSRKFGKDSKELLEFKKETSFHFDYTFGYRFFCKLRDYTIHCGMPMGNISATATRNEKRKVYENSVTLKFGRNELLQKFPTKKWGNIVGPELEKKEEFFSVSNLVYDTMLCIQNLNEKLVEFNKTLIDEATENILKALEINSNWDENYCLLLWKEQNGEKSIQISQIPFHLMRTKKKLPNTV
ncbi:hypothetical protein NLM59_07580 [Weeksellaceae bacterium KMM 9724]|uniref:hypothetical protein n=1 Tax=Profundicola chukchiensis TaxID=2961959 RepID=UPI00243C20B9|nr:hypothetical protein [Profundicola chukchiensis]MDG4950781.1 hypothetical protein [Profundicola chukchiensis]